MNRATKSDAWVVNPDGTPGFTANVFTGCLNGCDYCFAREIANTRLKGRYLQNREIAVQLETAVSPYSNPFFPRFWPEVLEEIRARKKPAGIFLNIMSDWAGVWWREEWVEETFATIRACPQHTFYLLTKQPQNLPLWNPYPDNCRVGVTVVANGEMSRALQGLALIKAVDRFISFEPLLGQVGMDDHRSMKGIVNWAIIGSMTCSPRMYPEMARRYPSLLSLPYGRRYVLMPRIEWVDDILAGCDRAGIPVFLKDNLVVPSGYLYGPRHPGLREAVSGNQLLAITAAYERAREIDKMVINIGPKRDKFV